MKNGPLYPVNAGEPFQNLSGLFSTLFRQKE
jgi:hypothetical protein